MKDILILTFNYKGNATIKKKKKVWSRLQKINQQLHKKLSSNSSWSLDFSKY